MSGEKRGGAGQRPTPPENTEKNEGGLPVHKSLYLTRITVPTLFFSTVTA